jgi:hypothetical protein
MRKKQGLDCDEIIKIIIYSLAAAANLMQKFAQRRESEREKS